MYLNFMNPVDKSAELRSESYEIVVSDMRLSLALREASTSFHSIESAHCSAYFGSMGNFKRKGPKSTRAGCLMCKPHKLQGQRLMMRMTFAEFRRWKAAREQLDEAKKTSE